MPQTIYLSQTSGTSQIVVVYYRLVTIWCIKFVCHSMYLRMKIVVLKVCISSLKFILQPSCVVYSGQSWRRRSCRLLRFLPTLLFMNRCKPLKRHLIRKKDEYGLVFWSLSWGYIYYILCPLQKPWTSNAKSECPAFYRCFSDEIELEMVKIDS